MRGLTRSFGLRFVAVPLMLITFLSACHRWVRLEPPLASAMTGEAGRTLRVTMADSQRFLLEDVRIEGDTLIGRVQEELSTGVTLPLDEVLTVESRHGNGGATAGLVAGVTIGTLAILTAIAVAVISAAD